MKKYKLKTTRPEFLLDIMAGGQVDSLTSDAMKKTLYDTNSLCYCAYTAIMEADVDRSDIQFVDNDGESIVIRFRSKSIANRVKDICNKEIVRYGNMKYKMKLKTRDQNLIIEAVPVEDEEESA